MNNRDITPNIDLAPSRSQPPLEGHIFLEMIALGIDPDPFIEVAAHDLINQFGESALDYSLQIERRFRDEYEAQSALIWKKISSYLQQLNGDGGFLPH